jgi:protein-L-isoaspartate(D-aspartate) O-methyltransferase
VLYDTNDALIGSIEDAGILKTPRIADAFRRVDRKYFVPDSYTDYRYIDKPLPIGNDQTISQPSTVAFMLELLQPREGDKVLDIGSGSGWTAALLCAIVGERGSVLGLERVESLVEQGRKNIEPFHFKHCRIEQAKSVLGVPGEQFDRILVSASAEEIPIELLDQLKVGGILVIPVRNSIYRFRKLAEDRIEQEEYRGFVFVPLIYEKA